MNYSLVNAQKADVKVEEAMESGEYKMLKDEAFNRENSKLLDTMNNDISKQQSQNQEQDQVEEQAQVADQGQGQEEAQGQAKEKALSDAEQQRVQQEQQAQQRRIQEQQAEQQRIQQQNSMSQ